MVVVNLTKKLKAKVLSNSLIIILLTVFFYACSTIKSSVSNINSSNTNELFDNASKLYKNKLLVTFKADAVINNKKQSLGGKIHFINDTSVYINVVSATLGFEIARIYFTGDSVYYIDKINKTYYFGFANKFNNAIKIPLNGHIINKLFSGKIIDFSRKNDTDYKLWNLSINDNYLKCTYFADSVNKNNYSNIYYNITNQIVNINSLANVITANYFEKNTGQKLEINYNSYSGKSKLPNSFTILYTNTNINFVINVNYKDISKLKTNYISLTVPKGYKTIN